MATGMAFFGSLGQRTNALLDQFSDEEVQVIQRFLTAAADALHDQVDRLERGG